MNAMDSIFLPRFTIGGKKSSSDPRRKSMEGSKGICSSCTGKSRSYDYYRMAVWT